MAKRLSRVFLRCRRRLLYDTLFSRRTRLIDILTSNELLSKRADPLHSPPCTASVHHKAQNRMVESPHPQDPPTRLQQQQISNRDESIYLLPSPAGSANVAQSSDNSSRNGNTVAAIGSTKSPIVTIPPDETTSSFSSTGDTLKPVSDPRRPKPAMLKMRIGIRLQLGLLVLSASLIALMVLTLAVWVRQHNRDGRTKAVLNGTSSLPIIISCLTLGSFSSKKLMKTRCSSYF